MEKIQIRSKVATSWKNILMKSVLYQLLATESSCELVSCD